MGQKLGININVPVGTEAFAKLWMKYSKGKMSMNYKDTEQFLKDMAATVGTKYDPKVAKEWIRDCDKDGDYVISAEEFLELFYEQAEVWEFTLTQSLLPIREPITKLENIVFNERTMEALPPLTIEIKVFINDKDKTVSEKWKLSSKYQKSYNLLLEGGKNIPGESGIKVNIPTVNLKGDLVDGEEEIIYENGEEQNDEVEVNECWSGKVNPKSQLTVNAVVNMSQITQTFTSKKVQREGDGNKEVLMDADVTGTLTFIIGTKFSFVTSEKKIVVNFNEFKLCICEEKGLIIK